MENDVESSWKTCGCPSCVKLRRKENHQSLCDALKDGLILATPQLFKYEQDPKRNGELVRAALLGNLAREKLKKETEE